jgi:hypothetical protein
MELVYDGTQETVTAIAVILNSVFSGDCDCEQPPPICYFINFVS